jgi:hypothetical protein
MQVGLDKNIEKTMYILLWMQVKVMI